MDYASIAVLVGTVLAAASVIFGAKYQQGKAKAKELAQLLSEVIEAAEDNEVSEEEFQKIVTSSKKILETSEA
jgi:CRISPR/Cas system CSM-associated protein Csm2 small subunit